MLLSDVKVGTKVCISHFLAGNRACRDKLLALGLLPGTEVLVERKAPLGDPIQLKFRGFALSLRHSEAALIAVEPLEAKTVV